MRRDIRNWGNLVDAVDELRNTPPEQPRILVFHDPGGTTFRFVFGQHGLVKLSSDRRGEAYPELSQSQGYKPEDS